mgnify:CR=1 FL=1
MVIVEIPQIYKTNEKNNESKKAINNKYNLFPVSPNYIIKLIFSNIGLLLIIDSMMPKTLKELSIIDDGFPEILNNSKVSGKVQTIYIIKTNNNDKAIKKLTNLLSVPF